MDSEIDKNTLRIAFFETFDVDAQNQSRNGDTGNDTPQSAFTFLVVKTSAVQLNTGVAIVPRQHHGDGAKNAMLILPKEARHGLLFRFGGVLACRR